MSRVLNFLPVFLPCLVRRRPHEFVSGKLQVSKAVALHTNLGVVHFCQVGSREGRQMNAIRMRARCSGALKTGTFGNLHKCLRRAGRGACFCFSRVQDSPTHVRRFLPALLSERKGLSMGIHGLTKLLSDEAPNCMKEVDLDSLTGRKVAVDASMAMYQFLVRRACEIHPRRQTCYRGLSQKHSTTGV